MGYKKELCFCPSFHCVSTIEKLNDEYRTSESQRFRFVKDNGVITNEIVIRGKVYEGGIADGVIADCPIRRDMVNRGKNPAKRPKKKKS